MIKISIKILQGSVVTQKALSGIIIYIQLYSPIMVENKEKQQQ